MAPPNTYSIGTVCDVVDVNRETLKKWIDLDFLKVGTQQGKWRWSSVDDVIAIAVMHALTGAGSMIPLRYAADVVGDHRKYFSQERWFILAGLASHGFSYRGSNDLTLINNWLKRTGKEEDEEITPLTAVIIPVHRIRLRVEMALRELAEAE